MRNKGRSCLLAPDHLGACLSRPRGRHGRGKGPAAQGQLRCTHSMPRQARQAQQAGEGEMAGGGTVGTATDQGDSGAGAVDPQDANEHARGHKPPWVQPCPPLATELTPPRAVTLPINLSNLGKCHCRCQSRLNGVPSVPSVPPRLRFFDDSACRGCSDEEGSGVGEDGSLPASVRPCHIRAFVNRRYVRVSAGHNHLGIASHLEGRKAMNQR